MAIYCASTCPAHTSADVRLATSSMTTSVSIFITVIIIIGSILLGSRRLLQDRMIPDRGQLPKTLPFNALVCHLPLRDRELGCIVRRDIRSYSVLYGLYSIRRGYLALSLDAGADGPLKNALLAESSGEDEEEEEADHCGA